MRNASKNFRKSAAADPLERDDFDTVDEVVEEADTTGPKSSNIPMINSIFHLSQDPHAIARVVANFKGDTRVINPLGTIREANGKTPVRYETSPSGSFSEAGTKTLPDLTNAYLNQLIGWYREQVGENPTVKSKIVWIKPGNSHFRPSQDESWMAIGHAIRNRTRNVETPATDLASHIRSIAIPLTKETLTSYIAWHEEKTGRPYHRNSPVWIKSNDGSWEIAPFRWQDIRHEFKKPEVCATLGANSLEQFDAKRRASVLDAKLRASHFPEPYKSF